LDIHGFLSLVLSFSCICLSLLNQASLLTLCRERFASSRST
jgi:hypothetical protein